MTSFDPPPWIGNLGPHYGLKNVLKSQEINEINTKSSQNACEMYKFMIFCNLMKKTGNYLIKVDFGQTYMEFDHFDQF